MPSRHCLNSGVLANVPNDPVCSRRQWCTHAHTHKRTHTRCHAQIHSLHTHIQEAHELAEKFLTCVIDWLCLKCYKPIHYVLITVKRKTNIMKNTSKLKFHFKYQKYIYRLINIVVWLIHEKSRCPDLLSTNIQLLLDMYSYINVILTLPS